jgi:hypothetical protein
MRHGAKISGQYVQNSRRLKRKTLKWQVATRVPAGVFTNKETCEISQSAVPSMVALPVLLKYVDLNDRLPAFKQFGGVFL